MEKLIKKFLTSKSHRNEVALIAISVAAMEAGIPWSGAK